MAQQATSFFKTILPFLIFIFYVYFKKEKKVYRISRVILIIMIISNNTIQSNEVNENYKTTAYEILKLLVDQKNTNFNSPIDPKDLDFFDQRNESYYRGSQQEKKPYTLLVYIAGDNDLRSFVARNIQQMNAVASNQNLNILIHLDIKISSNQKVTRRYFIASRDNIINTNLGDSTTQVMDSGDPTTLISAIQWAVKEYPAENYILILWDHGSGILDPLKRRIINPASLFMFNPITQMFDLDRSVGFIDLIEGNDYDQLNRGVCWDDTTHNYLNNQKLHDALDYACNNILKKKFALIGFDACLMSMVEVAHNIGQYSDLMVASQEVELGAGWNYQATFVPFLHGTPNNKQLARHMVKTYEQTYINITNDYTLSAIDLNFVDTLKQNIDTLALILLNSIEIHAKNSTIIKACAHPNNCTHFEEPSYVDLYDFYSNLENSLALFVEQKPESIKDIKRILHQGKLLIQQMVLAYTSGKNISRARGISIYFPTKSIHPSYRLTPFAKDTAWLKLISKCLEIA